MRKRSDFCTLRCFLVFCLVVVFCPLYAQDTGVDPWLDVMLVLDNSGSMKKNDPNGLLKKAVQEFAGGLTAENRIGILLFSEQVEPVLALTEVSDPQFSIRLSESLQHVDFSGKWTDIPGGIERAIYTLGHEGRQEAVPVIIFFTDGVIETGHPSRDFDRGQWLMENLTAEANQRGIRIFGVAFTEAADYQLIQSVSQSTGGEHYRVLHSSDIDDTFGRILQRIRQSIARTAPQKSDVTRPEPPPQNPSWLFPMFLGGLAFFMAGILFLAHRRLKETKGDLVPLTHRAHLIDSHMRSGRKRIPLLRHRTHIGRDSKNNDICLSQSTISSQHAVIEYRQGHYYLQDMRSSNGTFLNGERIGHPDSLRQALLKHGDHIHLDTCEFLFHLDTLPPTSVYKTADTDSKQQMTLLRREPLSPAMQYLSHGAGTALPETTGLSPALAPTALTLSPGEIVTDTTAASHGRNEFCTIHPERQVTETCPYCGLGRCPECMIEKDGLVLCRECARRTND